MKKKLYGIIAIVLAAAVLVGVIVWRVGSSGPDVPDPSQGTTDTPTDNGDQGTTDTPTDNGDQGTTDTPTDNGGQGTTGTPTDPSQGTTDTTPDGTTPGGDVTEPENTDPNETAPDGTTAPNESTPDGTEPVETDPTEPATEPTEPATDPTEPATEPTEPATTPTEPDTATDPTEDTQEVIPTEKPTEATEPVETTKPVHSDVAAYNAGNITYEVYSSWTAEQRREFRDSVNEQELTDDEAYNYYIVTLYNGYPGCGIEGHYCVSDEHHQQMLDKMAKGCYWCGSTDCIAFYYRGVAGATEYNKELCPAYNIYRDPSVYCQTCGYRRAAPWVSGEVYCRHFNQDTTCSWCGEAVTAGECHHCKRP